MKKVRWGLLAAGNIAKAFANGVIHSKTGELAAVGSRSFGNAERFANQFSIPGVHGSYEALLADADVDAVYISTPHPMHAEWICKAAEAGKHILCEKPLTLNYAEAMVAMEAARVNDVLLMEAFMVRCHPLVARIADAVRAGAIGELRLIRAAFGFDAPYNPESRIFSNALGGGGILDVGCYTTTISRLLAGVAQGKPFADPVKVNGACAFAETGVDSWAVGALAFDGGIFAQISCSVQLGLENGLELVGSGGRLVAPNLWIPAKEGGEVTFSIHRPKAEPEQIVVQTDDWLYSFEVDAFGRALQSGARSVPEVPIEDTAGNMQTLDAWRAAVGLKYDAEKPSPTFPTVKRTSLTQGNQIPTTEFPGANIPVSRLVLGCDNQQNFPFAAAMFDDFFERGGNAFDTAYIYGNGLQEKLLGQWIRVRGVRDQIFVIAKGAHTPFCEPKFIKEQLNTSLERLQCEHADLYMMHRDNPEIPVGEFVVALNELVNAGKIRQFGGSNWPIERVIEANVYAADHGLQGFAAVSNNFSLARMIDPVWAGCVSSSDADSREILEDAEIALFAWSSQARGFFTDRVARDRLDDPELVRCWVSEDNFERRDRAIELAKNRGATPIQIALAYVLNQPFSTFALIGPRQISETRMSVEALGVELSSEELRWLNLES